MNGVIGRAFWVLLAESLCFPFTIATADAQVVRICGVNTQKQCDVTGCRLVQAQCWGTGTIVADASGYKPGKSLVLGCGHHFQKPFDSIWVQGWRATLLAKEQTEDSDLSLLEVDHDFAAFLPIADQELEEGRRAWVMGFGGDGVVRELPGTNCNDNSILAQTRVGDSGGPVLTNKVIYGVLWGQENIGREQLEKPRARYTCVRSIRRFVEKRGYGRYVFRSRTVGVNAPPPPAEEKPPVPLPTPDPVGHVGPSSQLEERIAALETRIAQLEQRPADGPSDSQLSSVFSSWISKHKTDVKGDPGQRGPAGKIDLEIVFQDKHEVLKDLPSGSHVTKRLDKLVTEPK